MPPYGGGRNNTISLQIILTDPTVVFIRDHFSGLEPHIGPGAVMCPDSSVDVRGATENASTENESTGGWNMQVRKTQVRICNGGKRKYSNLKSI